MVVTFYPWCVAAQIINFQGVEIVKQDKIPLMLRIDETIHKKIKYASEKEVRSLNGQIEYYIIKGLADFEKEYGEIPTEEEN